MDTKWKNRVLLSLALLFCLGGWYITYISANRINDINATDYKIDYHMVESLYMKENIDNYKENRPEEVTQDQIESYRQRYGDLGTQVLDIKNQYEEKIGATSDEKEATKLKKERDSKIKAVVENFTDDGIVKDKIFEEELAYLEKNKKKILADSEEYISSANELYQYYFEDLKTGKVYTNVAGLNKYSTDKEIKTALKKEGYGKIEGDEFSVSVYNFITPEARASSLFQSTLAVLKGYSMITEDTAQATQVKEQEKNRDLLNQLIYVGLFLMIVGIIILYLYVNTAFSLMKLNKIPIDIACILFLVLGLFAAVSATTVQPYNLSSWSNVSNIFIPFVVGILCLGISFVSLKVMWQKLTRKHREATIKDILGKSFICVSYNKILSYFKKLPWSLKVMVVVLILLCQLFFVSVWLKFYIGRFIKLVIGIGLVIVFSIEIKWFRDISKKIYQLFSQSKKILAIYEQETSDEFSLDEMLQEMTQVEQLVKISQKDTMKSDMLKAELLTNVSHDLRTPLTSIITYGELLKQTELSEEDRKEYVQIINKKSQRMKHLIDDLFEVTKMNNGEIILEKSEVNLTQLLQQSVSEYSEEFEDHQLKVVFNKPDEAINLLLDGERMWRVFDNMFGNAIKYSMPETRVYLKLEKQEEFARIEVKNISRHELNENADELVEKFKRGDSSRHTEGAGLGLAIVNSIVSLHGGNIDIQVDGDMFKLTIYLPL